MPGARASDRAATRPAEPRAAAPRDVQRYIDAVNSGRLAPRPPSQNTCRDTRNDSRRELLKKCTLRFLFAEGFMCDAPCGVSKDQTEIVFQLTAERPDLLLFFPPVYLPLYLAEQQPSSPSWSDHHCLGTGHQQNTHISCRILVWGGLDKGGQDFGRTNFLTKFLSPLF